MMFLGATRSIPGTCAAPARAGRRVTGSIRGKTLTQALNNKTYMKNLLKWSGIIASIDHNEEENERTATPTPETPYNDVDSVKISDKMACNSNDDRVLAPDEVWKLAIQASEGEQNSAPGQLVTSAVIPLQGIALEERKVLYNVALKALQAQIASIPAEALKADGAQWRSLTQAVIASCR